MLCFDLDCLTPDALRSETIRAVRSTVRRFEPAAERLPEGAPSGLLRRAAALLRDLEQGLAAISHSLAEGIDVTVERRCTSP